MLLPLSIEPWRQDKVNRDSDQGRGRYEYGQRSERGGTHMKLFSMIDPRVRLVKFCFRSTIAKMPQNIVITI